MTTTLSRSATKPKETTIDKSGLTALDWMLMTTDMAWRAVVFSLEDAAERSAKLKRLDALLDDPAIAQTHDRDHPDRLRAMSRHVELWAERERYREEARDGAKDVSKLWIKLPTEYRTWYPQHLVSVWCETRLALAFAFVGMEAKLWELPFWKALSSARETVAAGEQVPCPF